MKMRMILLLLTTVLFSGCTSMFGGSSAPKMAYIGDLANNRVARAGESIAYSKDDEGEATFAYIFRGVDGKGGIHVNKVRRTATVNKKSSRIAGWFSGDSPKSEQYVFLPEQTLLVSPGVHIVFIKSTPRELHYRVIMTSR